MERTILHYDMDAFFASIEIRDNPSLKNKAVAVGTGVICSCNYIARGYKLKSAMSVSDAKKICKDLVVVKPKTNYYFKIGKDIQTYISKYFKNTKFISCDEGFIDITDIIKNDDTKIHDFCIKFKNMIYEKFKLSLSIGVGLNRAMAKMATEVNKPNGIHIFYTKDQFIDYVMDKKISIFPSIGKTTTSTLESLGIVYTKDILYRSKEELINLFGNLRANQIYSLVRGEKESFYEEKEENTNTSISKEKTFYPELENEYEAIEELKILSELIKKEIDKKKEYPKTLSLKLRYSNFKTITKSKTYEKALSKDDDIFKLALDLFEETEDRYDIRLIGLTISHFYKERIEYITLF